LLVTWLDSLSAEEDDMSEVLVTDGNQRSTLALTRAIGRQGISVTVAEKEIPCLSSQSKYCSRTLVYRSPSSDPSGFIEDIFRALKDHNYDLLIPMTDLTVFLVIENRKKFSPYVRIPLPEKEVFRKACDKAEVLKLAQENGIPIPRTYFAEDLEGIKNIAHQLSYPVVIKPRRSWFFVGNGWIHLGVNYAYSAEELVFKWENQNKLLSTPLIQERITGPGCGVFALFNRGTPRAVFFHKRLREKPPSGGVSVLSESIPVDVRMKRYSIRMLEELGWHGVAMIEFKLDQKEHRPKLMEINPRFWGSLQLAIHSGVNFPYLLYRMSMEGDVEPVWEYQVGVKNRWLLGDLDHLLARLLKSNKALQLPLGFPSRWKSWWRFLKFSERNLKYEILTSDDPRPALFEIKEYLRRFTIKGA
jgi:predicted ATP-grasp superfamily ATP-dependent carboligase